MANASSGGVPRGALVQPTSQQDYYKSLVSSQLVAERGEEIVVVNPGSANVRIGLASAKAPAIVLYLEYGVLESIARNSPSHIAARYGLTDIITMSGGDIHAVNYEGVTPLIAVEARLERLRKEKEELQEA